MTNKVDVVCPNCNNPISDVLGYITRSTAKNTDVIRNVYKCLKCKRQFKKLRTDKNSHPEFFK